MVTQHPILSSALPFSSLAPLPPTTTVTMRASFVSALCLLQAGAHALPAPQNGSTATSTITAISTLTTTTASSTPSVYNFTAGAVTEYPIHESCNSTLRRQLERALDETVELASHARDHILRFGGDSPLVQKYFGNGSATAAPLGWFSRIAAGDRRNMTFRCDDPDKNCATQEGTLLRLPTYLTLPRLMSQCQ